MKPFSPRDPAARIPPPPGLRGKRFSFEGEEYAVLVVPVAEAQATAELLTSAEQEVAKLVLRGFSNDEIAALRDTATRTVAVQLQSIYRKLRVGSRVELARHLQGER